MDHEAIQVALMNALKEEEYTEAGDITFHMVDWLKELEELNKLYSNIEKYDSEKIVEVLMRFLIHVPNHVAAAGMLLAESPVSDIFGVNAVEDVLSSRKDLEGDVGVTRDRIREIEEKALAKLQHGKPEDDPGAA